MNTIGFKGFTKPTKITAEQVTEKLARLSHEGLFVYWSGSAYRWRRGSGRSGVLALVTEKKRPIPLKTLIERAAKATDGGLGYTPDFVRSGLFLHGGSKPSVFFAVTKNDNGDLVAARDYPFPDESVSVKPIKAGQVIVKAKEKAPRGSKKELEAPGEMAAITDQSGQ